MRGWVMARATQSGLRLPGPPRKQSCRGQAASLPPLPPEQTLGPCQGRGVWPGGGCQPFPPLRVLGLRLLRRDHVMTRGLGL